MSKIYKYIAPYYEELQSNINYDALVKLITYYAKAKSMILDIGCGDGKLIRKLKNTNNDYHLVGCDISYEMIKIAKQKTQENAKCAFFNTKVENLDYYLRGFDVIILTTDTLNYFINKKQLLSLRDSIQSRLKKGGLLIFDIQKQHNIEYFNHYHEIKILNNGYVLDWQSQIVNKNKHLVKHRFKVYNNDNKLLGSEIHYQSFKALPSYLLLFKQYFSIKKLYYDDYRYYVVLTRR